jgi:hypothetical protein
MTMSFIKTDAGHHSSALASHAKGKQSESAWRQENPFKIARNFR